MYYSCIKYVSSEEFPKKVTDNMATKKNHTKKKGHDEVDLTIAQWVQMRRSTTPVKYGFKEDIDDDKLSPESESDQWESK